jgi:hypothetical protein
MSRILLVTFSDSHGGHKFGLLSPDVVFYDEDNEGTRRQLTPQLTSEQLYLYGLYQEHIAKCVEIAGKDDIYLAHNGDATQGTKYKDQLVSNRIADQIFIAEANMRHWLVLPNTKKFAVIAGTPAHNLGEGSSEILIADALQREYPEKKIRALYHGLWPIEGYTVDISHHGPTVGWRDWTKGNVARLYARDIMMRALNFGIDPPNLIIRSHHHDFVTEVVELRRGDKLYSSRIVVTPSYCLVGDFGRQAVKSPFMVTNGLVAFEIVDGYLHEMHLMLKSSDIRTKDLFLDN